MKRVPLFWLVFPSFVAITLGLLLLVFLEGAARLREFHEETVKASLETEARMFAETADDLLSNGNLQQGKVPELDALAKRLGRVSEVDGAGGVRITVVLPNGKVVAESDRDPELMADHRTRPEIAGALADQQVHWDIRPSPTLGGEFLYVALPVVRGGETIAVVRTAKSMAVIQQALDVLKKRILWARPWPWSSSSPQAGSWPGGSAGPWS